MTNKYLIESKLESINDAAFQSLCNELLFCEKKELHSQQTTGSMVAKEKTVKGTPDTFFLDADQKFVFVEYTTNSSLGVKKIIDDINACYDEDKSKIPSSEISKIIICYNFKLTPEEVLEVTKTVAKRSELELWSIDTLSSLLEQKYHTLASKYLGIDAIVSQLVPIDDFVEENKAYKGLGTPLDNPFVGRNKDISAIKSMLDVTNIAVVYGKQGYGKTRICLEALKEKQSKVLCVSDKHVSIAHELSSIAEFGGKIILFVDDANRVNTINEILSVYRCRPDGEMKILMSVRDYALQDIVPLLSQYGYKSYQVDRMSDDDITAIIKDEPYSIKNQRFIDRILEIADGSPRLAIMASSYARQNKTLPDMYSIEALFEQYFCQMSNDTKVLTNRDLLKVAGLVSYFRSVADTDGSLLPICSSFGIDKNSFVQAADELVKYEVVYKDRQGYSIREQNVRDYLFYHCFVKDEVIPFDSLLSYDINHYISLLSDCLHSICNIFGFTEVCKKVEGPIEKHFIQLKSNDPEQALDLLGRFWVFIPNESFQYMYDTVHSFAIPEGASYSIEGADKNDWHEDNKLEKILFEMLAYNQHVDNALPILFDYSLRFPGRFPKVTRRLSERFNITPHDVDTGFPRQHKCFKHFSKVIGKRRAFQEMFTFTVTHLLGIEFTDTAVRGVNYSILSYKIPNTYPSVHYREAIWSLLCNIDKDLARAIIRSTFPNTYQEGVDEVLKADILGIMNVIEKMFLPSDVADVLCVHDTIEHYAAAGISVPDIDTVKKRFDSEYLNLRELFREDYKLHTKEQREKIASSGYFRDNQSVTEWYKKTSLLYDAEEDHRHWYYSETMLIAADYAFEKSFHMGLCLIKNICENNFSGVTPVAGAFKYHHSKQHAECLWETISCTEDNWAWRFSYLQNLPKEYVDETQIGRFRQLIEEWEERYYLFLPRFQGFVDYSTTFIHDIIRWIIEINSAQGMLHIKVDLTEKENVQIFKDDYELLGSLFCQQLNLCRTPVLHEGVAKYVISKDRAFLSKIVESIGTNSYCGLDSYEHIDFGFIWDFDDIDTEVDKCLQYIGANEFSITGESFFQVFFKSLSQRGMEKAVQYLRERSKQFCKDLQLMDLLIEVGKISLKEAFREIVLEFLKNNDSIDDFKQLSWTRTRTVFYGDENPASDHLAGWETMMTIINGSEYIDRLPLKLFVEGQVASCQKKLDERGGWNMY